MTPRERINFTIADAAARYRVGVADVLGPCKAGDIMQARRLCYLRLSQMGFGPCAIGRHLNRDHSTVLHNLRKLSNSPERHGPRSDDSEARAPLTASE